MFFLTYNDAPTGIYFSQVIDVCQFITSEFKIKIHLISFISLRNFFFNRKKIKSAYPSSIVLPIFPTIQLWKLNIIQLFFILLFFSDRRIIARGPFAANLALMLKKFGMVGKVIFDARAAYAAELNEYNVTNNKKIKNNIFSIEEKALLQSDFRLAVSEKLVEWWKDKFEYKSEKHVIIPCTLGNIFLNDFPLEQELKVIRKKYSFEQTDIVIAFSGSSSQWHSFSMVDVFLSNILKKYHNVKILFLSNQTNNLNFIKLNPARVIQMWLPENNVREVLLAADYGLLIREKFVTNKVSSPVKFAEYLACGLKVLISDEIGDFSEFVIKNNCGELINDLNKDLELSRNSYQDKLKLNNLALNYFSKRNFINEYKTIIQL